MSYIHFTDEQKQQANSVDLESFLRGRGEDLLPSGRDKRLASDHSITICGDHWYDHDAQKGGYAISFVQYHYGVSYPDAVTMLLDSGVEPWIEPERLEPKSFSPPAANDNMHRVFAYLIKERKINAEVVAQFARRKLIYEDAEYHNAVFAGMDEHGAVLHAHKRSAHSKGKPFRQNVAGSDPRYSFHYLGTDGLLFVFEAPIDLLSYITLHPDNWEQHSYLACCGTSSIPLSWILAQKQFGQAYLCLDNDKAGLAAGQRMEELLSEKNISCKSLTPKNKDWNDDLQEAADGAVPC